MSSDASKELDIVPIGPVQLVTDRDLWERQPGESDMAWEAFVVFRDLDPGKRTIKHTYELVSGHTLERASTPHGDRVVPSMNFGRYCNQFHWRERAFAYDRYMDDKYRKELEASRVKARVETADLGRTMRRKAAEALAELKTILYTRGPNGEITLKSALTSNQIVKLAEVGVRLERLALGEGDGEGSLVLIGQQYNIISDVELIDRAQQIIAARQGGAAEVSRLRSGNVDGDTLLPGGST